MLPRNIDLTAHSDFNDHELFTIANVRRLRNEDFISLDEWDVLQWWESIFGKKDHPNRTEHIFSPIKRWERRIPWEPMRTSIEIASIRFPWYEEPRVSSRLNAKEIFQLR